MRDADPTLAAWLAHCAACWEVVQMKARAEREVERQAAILEGFGVEVAGG